METKTLTPEQLAERNKELTSANTELKHMVDERTVYLESTYSFNTTLNHQTFGRGQFTIRGRAGEDGASFLWRVQKMLEKLPEMGWMRGELLPSDTQRMTPPNKEQPAPQATQPEGAQQFAASTLSCNVMDGKQFWKIKGGHFEKFGISVYPEVLTPAGFTKLDPMQMYDLTGWTAYYSLKDDGKPQKITRLVKNGA